MSIGPLLYIVALLLLTGVIWWRRGFELRLIASLLVVDCALSNVAVALTDHYAPVLWFAAIYTLAGVAVLWPRRSIGMTAKLVGYGYIPRLIAAWATFIVTAYFSSTGTTVEGRYLDIDAGAAWLQLAALLWGASYGRGHHRFAGVHRGNRIAAPDGFARRREIGEP